MMETPQLLCSQLTKNYDGSQTTNYSLSGKLALALAITLILDSESHGTSDHILLSDGSGSLKTLALLTSTCC